MASLTHVRMWTEKKGWENVTAAEATAIFPRGTIPAKSGLFVCDLCGQYVTLTDGDILDRYFKHSAYETSKNCPERTFGSGYSMSSNFKKAELPIKISDITEADFYFEIGFVYIPQDILVKQSMQYVVIHIQDTARSYKYSFDRLKESGVTYLNVGNFFARSYKIECDENLRTYWPETVTGIDPNGNVFDGSSRRKLVYNSDVTVGKKYLLLVSYKIRNEYEHINISLISKRTDVNWRTWYLYEVEATDFKQDAVMFFLRFNCRLTDNPLSFQPMWPVYNADTNIVKHLGGDIAIHVRGDDGIQIYSFPIAPRKFGYKEGRQVISIDCKNRHQLVTAGRSMTMQYLYIWEDSLDYETKTPNINVRDIKGNTVTEGVSNTLPYQNGIVIIAPFDGEVIISDEEGIKERFALQANKSIDIFNLRYGYTVKVYQGLDEIWSISFLKEKRPETEDDGMLLKKLENFSGQEIKIGHSIGAVIERIGDYPKTQKWVYGQIQKGYISAYALAYLKRFIADKNGI